MDTIENRNKHTILVADNDPGIRFLLEFELAEEGNAVITVSDADLLPDLVNRLKPDLIIMDNHWGGFHGLKLLQYMRNVDENIPVILFTAYVDIVCAAVDEHVIKSSDLTELKDKVKFVLEGGLGGGPEGRPVSRQGQKNLEHKRIREQYTIP